MEEQFVGDAPDEEKTRARNRIHRLVENPVEAAREADQQYQNFDPSQTAQPPPAPAARPARPSRNNGHSLPVNPNAKPGENPFMDVPLPAGFKEKPLG